MRARVRGACLRARLACGGRRACQGRSGGGRSEQGGGQGGGGCRRAARRGGGGRWGAGREERAWRCGGPRPLPLASVAQGAAASDSASIWATSRRLTRHGALGRARRLLGRRAHLEQRAPLQGAAPERAQRPPQCQRQPAECAWVILKPDAHASNPNSWGSRGRVGFDWQTSAWGAYIASSRGGRCTALGCHYLGLRGPRPSLKWSEPLPCRTASRSPPFAGRAGDGWAAPSQTANWPA